MRTALDKPIGFQYIYWRWELHLMLQTLASSPGFFCRDLCVEEMRYIYMCELEREKADLDRSLTLGNRSVMH